MQVEDVLGKLDDSFPEASRIVRSELDAGNEVGGVTNDWPVPGESLTVTMKRPFSTEYDVDAEYHEDRNPHYRDWVGRVYMFSEAVVVASPY